jgi:hypothetical protein
MSTFEEFTNTLTIEQAAAWTNTQEKTLFVDYEILGPADIRWTEARQDAVEKSFYRLLVARFVNWNGEAITPDRL